MSVGRRGVSDGSECVDQAPGWDGQVAGTARLTTGKTPVVATATKNAPRGGSPTGRECDKNQRAASGVSTETMTTLCDGGQEALIACTAAGIEKRNATVEIADIRLAARSPSRGDDWSVSQTALLSELEAAAEEERHHHQQQEQHDGVFSDSSDEDTAAMDGNSAEINSDSAGESTARDATGESQGNSHASINDFLGIAPGSDGTVSELSCSTTLTAPSATDDGDESDEQLRVDNCTTSGSSSESPNQARVTSGGGDDDDISTDHIEHLIQARRRWQLRAIESEHELASMRSLHARMERGGARAMQPPSARSSTYQAPTRVMQDSGSFSEPALSETLAVEPEFEPDDQSQAPSNGVDRAASVSPCSAGVLCDEEKESPLGFSDVASEAQFVRSTSSTSDRLPARNEARYDAASHNNNNDFPAPLVNGDEIGDCYADGQGKDGAHRLREAGINRFERGAAGSNDHGTFGGGDDDSDDDDNDDEKCHNGTGAYRLLQQEIVDLKEKVRKAELRHAAAEATAASVLQRARAAELARDVKEIKVRECHELYTILIREMQLATGPINSCGYLDQRNSIITARKESSLHYVSM